ncbi:MAG: SNF2-related protein, partial [Candidatus Cloacimonetes bacterium]|nr:SNF2-related protein [Candidatus Cloacimonadota bacterium]
MAEIITNDKLLLERVIRDILPNHDRLHFLVGYFYFSGFNTLCDNLKDKSLRILVGMDIEREFSNQIKQFGYVLNQQDSNLQIRQRYFENLIHVFNDTNYFDNPINEANFRTFLNMIENGLIQIRKTRQPNHSKLYLFEKKESLKSGGLEPGILITGSSNLSVSGLSNRKEFNILISEKNDFLAAEEYFNTIWEDAVDIVDQTTFPIFKEQFIEKTWIGSDPEPFVLFLRVLQEYFHQEDSKIKMPEDISQNYLNLEYQKDAIIQGIDKLNRHNGVIIADVVGLGKSIIASVIAYNIGLPTIIICPPHLIEQWKHYKLQFKFPAEVFSAGKIDEVYDWLDNKEEYLIIIDEAHRFRNNKTHTHAELHKICAGNKVLILSATPYNNYPQDIYSLISLFQIPAKSTIQTIDNLASVFHRLIKDYKKLTKDSKDKKITDKQYKEKISLISNQIRNILSPVLIRRTRTDLIKIPKFYENIKMQGIDFPKVLPPEILTYELNEISDLYLETLEMINSNDEKGEFFGGVRYKPVVYLKESYKNKARELLSELSEGDLFIQAQRNISKFMRRLLVRRFESSIEAFNKSLISLIRSSEIILEWYERLNVIPVFKKGKLPDIDDILEETGDDMQNELFEAALEKELESFIGRGLVLIPRDYLKKEFATDLSKDIAVLKKIYANWFENRQITDYKLKGLQQKLSDKLTENPHRKIVLFSEFADTIDYLYKNLKDDFRVMKYTSDDYSSANRKTISLNFDASVPTAKQKNDYDIILATDAISEGFNLHRAGVIFNYDIPYNPTRVIQRVGRINRIDKKTFNEIFICNYFPTPTGERETRTREITTLKFSIINNLLGSDTLVLHSDEELVSYYHKQFNDLQKAEEQESWDTKYRELLDRMQKKEPELWKKAQNLSHRSRTAKINTEKQGVVVLGKKGSEFIFKYSENGDKIISLSSQEAIPLFESDVFER